jgi:hypothetical protein
MWWTLLKVLDRDASRENRNRLTSLSDGIFSKIHHIEEDRVESTMGNHTLHFRVIRVFRGPPIPRYHHPNQTPCPSSLRVKPPRAKPFASLASWRETPARQPRPPHIARIDYDYEHRCAEHGHDHFPFP